MIKTNVYKIFLAGGSSTHFITNFELDRIINANATKVLHDIYGRKFIVLKNVTHFEYIGEDLRNYDDY
ncbi:hypothetical protein LSP03_42850 [Lysinibacillus sphaericus]|nr:hypothetical protein LSP03_42850 [Lysinibacillus sphaericus]